MKEKKGNLILLWNYRNWGGAQVYFLSIIREALDDWNIKVVLPEGSSPDFLKFLDELNVEYDFLTHIFDGDPADTIKRKIQRHISRLKVEYETYRYLKNNAEPGTIFHLEGMPWQSWILHYLLTRRGKVFITLHNALGRQPAWREWVWKKRLGFLMSQDNFHLFSANQQTIEGFKYLLDEKNRKKITLTRASISPVEIEKVLEKDFNRKEILESIGLSGKEKIVLGVGQFIDRKGRWIFLEAAQKIIEKYPETGFVWLMPELPDDEDLQKIESFGLKDSFKAVKSSSVGDGRAAVLNFFRIADVFALPSLWEGLPISILEAMALGICTVSTNINAIPEAIINMETGLLIEPDDSSALVTALDKLFSDGDLREKLARQGKEFALKNFDERFWAKEAIKQYEASLSNRNTE